LQRPLGGVPDFYQRIGHDRLAGIANHTRQSSRTRRLRIQASGQT